MITLFVITYNCTNMELKRFPLACRVDPEELIIAPIWN